MPVENLLTPDYVRRVLWQPPGESDDGTLEERVVAGLRDLGARRWQIELTSGPLTTAIVEAKPGEVPAPPDGDIELETESAADEI